MNKSFNGLHFLTILVYVKNFFKYLTRAAGRQDWGANIFTSGYHQVRPGDTYPPPGHPRSHKFTWTQGRRLKGFHIVYIPTGTGVFETREKRFDVNPGDMLLLYANQWHRYKPKPNEGWEEYWIGFDGDFFEDSIKQEVFPKSESYVKRIGYKDEIIFLMNQSLELIKRNTNGHRKILAGILIQLLAYTITTEDHPVETRVENIGDRTIRTIRAQLHKEIDFQELAAKFHLSYSRFRTLFKQQTGLGLQQYLIRERIQNAHRLLSNTDKGIKEIASMTGFKSVYYFSRIFRKKTGFSPTEIRRKKIEISLFS